MREMFGVLLAKIAAEFKLDVEDRLAEIMPAMANTDSDDDDARRPVRRARDRLLKKGQVKTLPCCARGGGVTRHPRMGAAR
jgi:hypothetical protein